MHNSEQDISLILYAYLPRRQRPATTCTNAQKTTLLRAGVEGRQSRAEGSGGGRAPPAGSPLVGHGDVHSGDGCRDRMREACALPRGAQRVIA